MSTFDRYSVNEEIVNSLLHIIGIYMSVVFSTIICISAYNTPDFSFVKFASVLIYGISLTLMFTMSSAYHAVQYIPAKRILKILDHIAIYFAIAGMNTPICMIILKPNSSIFSEALLSLQWFAVCAGTIFKIFTTGQHKVLSTSIYLALGWMMCAAIKPVLQVCDATQITYLIAGGVLYTVGSIFYMMKSIRYMHCVWHMFVLIASICHFLFILSII